MSSLPHWHVKGSSSKRVALKVDVLQDPKIYCLQARPCIIQPRNCTGWGSEGVNRKDNHPRWPHRGATQVELSFSVCETPHFMLEENWREGRVGMGWGGDLVFGRTSKTIIRTAEFVAVGITREAAKIGNKNSNSKHFILQGL